MNIVAHNLFAMNASRQLNITNKNKAKNTEKLSSGYRINSASDDAAGLSISEKMRRQIRGLSQGVRNTQDGVSVCQVADGALAEVSEMLHRMTELSVQSANGTNSDTDRQAIQKEISQIKQEIERIGDTTEFNERKIFDGSCEAIDYQYNKPNNISSQDAWNQLVNKTYKEASSDIVYKGVRYSKDYINAYLAYQSSNVMYWDMLNQDLKYDGPNGKNTTLIMKQLKKIAGNDNDINKGLLACNAIDNNLYEKRKNVSELVKKQAMDIVGMQPPQAYAWLSPYSHDGSDKSIGNFSSSVAQDIQYQIQQYARNEAIPSFKTVFTGLWNMKNVYFNLSGDFTSDIETNNSPSTQNTVISDFKKIQDLLNGYNPDGTINEEMRKRGVWIQSGSEAGNGMYLGIDRMNTNVLGISDLDVSTVDGANHALSAINSALEKVSANRSKIGAQQNRLEHTIANENNVVENTTAAESRIRDVDMAKEMVEFSKNMILDNVGQAMLAQANKNNEGLLSLLQ